jgi:hypothetical protein
MSDEKGDAVQKVIEAIETLGLAAVVQLCADGCAVESDGEMPEAWMAARWARYERELKEMARKVAAHELRVRAATFGRCAACRGYGVTDLGFQCAICDGSGCNPCNPEQHPEAQS